VGRRRTAYSVCRTRRCIRGVQWATVRRETRVVCVAMAATVKVVHPTPTETLAHLVSGGLELDRGELNSILRTAWPQMHGPLFHHDTAVLLALFRQAGYVSDGPAYPSHALTIYRGEPVASEQPGISWTTTYQVALTYARGYSTIGDVRLRQATAPVTSVLARFLFEDEVVVDPGLLEDVAVKGYIPHFKLSLG
jgi:hypothetical protein